jgi:hypothetical protein
MATATKKPTAVPTPPEPGRDPAPHALRAVDSVYRFLASLKLAVITLSALAATLAYATWFESTYGTAAVQEWVYRSKGFAVLLAFLGANILCAALIRFPWKKRQTGFVITHAGLLIVLAGSWYSVMTADEGQVAFLEGESKEELVRNDYPVIRIRQVDPHSPDVVEREWELPFRPGTFAWGPGQPKPRSLVEKLSPSSLLSGHDERKPVEVLTKPKDPFQVVVKSFIPASIPATLHVADPSGTPMVKIRPLMKAPGMPKVRDVFDPDDRWFESEGRIHKVVRAEGPAQFAFLYVDRPELVDDFLNPPADPGNDGVARLRYVDKAGKPRVYDWKLDGQAGKTVTLPDSDLSVKFPELLAFPAAEAGLGRMLGASTVPYAQFEVSKGGAPPVKHMALAGLPMIPNVIPSREDQTDGPPRPLVSINYDLPPLLDSHAGGLFGVIEVLGTPEGATYYRVWGRPEAGKSARSQLRSKGPIKTGQPVVAFGGNPGMPMTLSFEVEEYLTKGVSKDVCEPVVLPKGQMGNGIAACLVEMTVKDGDKESTKEFYVRRSNTLDQVWKSVAFPDGRLYQVSYDVDRKPLGFDLKLVDFQRGFDPGTEQASRFSSDVLLTDKAQGLDRKPFHIWMNNPLTHRGYTFYQSSYIREEDPRTGRETGRVQSVLQVASNPGRPIIYSGCLLVIAGAFVQFYMRAGVFTDGGKRERERAAARSQGNGAADVAVAARAKAKRRSDEVL